jgi:F0F1-type ATP synthase membrane subunit c/vacuolar-type H+-ATPase subunit K
MGCSSGASRRRSRLAHVASHACVSVPAYQWRVPRDGQDGLIVLRQVLMTFCIALALIGLVIALLYPSSAPPADPPDSLCELPAAPRCRRGVANASHRATLNCTDDSTLASSYRARFFLRVAFANAAALFGFIGFFLTNEWWPYPVGLAIAACGLIRAAPTRERLRRDQERLAETSCFRRLVPALRSSMRPRA